MSLHRHKFPLAATSLLSLAVIVGACSSSSTATQNVAGASQAPVVTPAPVVTQAPAASQAASQPATGGSTVLAKTVGGQTILVAGSNGMTVYTFTKDTAGSGQSACSGQCLVVWPALTIPAGSQPTGGDGVSGKLGTITRSDNGALQVTYNGLPLYFYQKDSAPGDTNGNYPNWNLVKP